MCQSCVPQMLEDWDCQVYERCLDSVEEAILVAAQDALAETRAAGRSAFAAYCRARPERMHALLTSQPPGLQQKLREAIVGYTPGD